MGSSPGRDVVAGDVLASRFVLERQAGAGGMGTVWRAYDRATEAVVAVKVMSASADAERFLQETRVLAALAHPGIVRFVTSGTGPGGEPFLAMEWLEGEDVGALVVRRGFTVAESISLARGAALALAEAHAHGIVHRDVKPTNLFVVGEDPSRVKVLDFGIARARLDGGTAPRPLTRTGVVVGTVGYMAPEQARGGREVDERTDVFSLGCVLFECLTGQPPFAGEHAVAVLAKVLLEEVPDVRELRPSVPAAVADLVARMLEKDPARRPARALDVVHALDDITAAGLAAPAAMESRAPLDAGDAADDVAASQRTITTDERRLVSIAIVDLASAPEEDARTLTPDEATNETSGAVDIVARHGGAAFMLGGRSIVVTLAGAGGSARDQAAIAARTAIALRERFPGARIALATGAAASTSGRAPVGPVIDAAVGVLRATREGEIRVDAVCAPLLDARFVLDVPDRRGGQRIVAALRTAEGGDRTLLGKPTPCVGRDKELALLEATFAEAVDEPVARAVLVTAPPGFGKSRIARELVARVRASRPEASVLLARCEPIGAGSALGPVRQIVRAAADLAADASPEAVADALQRRLKRIGLADDQLVWATELLSELVGAGPASPSPQLRAARNDAFIMENTIRRWLVAWLDAESRLAPVLLVFEDLQWGDRGTIAHVDTVLRALRDRPLMAVALARPEVHALFPDLWRAAALQEVNLAGLTRSASERLVRSVLGAEVSAEVVARVVERADGNAFYLEELVRHVATAPDARAAAELPATVLAMAQSRLDALDAEDRRCLRAASVFGDRFSLGGVLRVIAGAIDDAAARRDLERRARRLVEREVLVTVGGRHDDFAFRHSLIREAAYATLTDADRRTAHRVAATFLESTGDADPLAIAEHFERGGAADRAAPFLLRTARAALDAGELESAASLAARGLASGATGEVRGRLLATRVESHGFRWMWQEALEEGAEALALLPPGEPEWFTVAGSGVLGAIVTGKIEIAVPLVPMILSVENAPRTGPRGFGVAIALLGLLFMGQREAATALLARVDSEVDAATPDDPAFTAWLDIARCEFALIFFGDVGAALDTGHTALAAAALAGDLRASAQATLQLAQALGACGATEEVDAHLARVFELMSQTRLPHLAVWARSIRARDAAARGRFAEAEDIARAAMNDKDHLSLAVARMTISECRLAAGDLASACSEAETVLKSTPPVPVAMVMAHNVLGAAAIGAGRYDDARRHGKAALEMLDARGGWPTDRSRSHLLSVEAEMAAGDLAAAREASRVACERLEAIASRIADPRLRRAFLEDVSANARTLALAREL